MAWGKAGSTTLTGAGDTITVSGITASKFNQTLSHVIQTTSNIRMATRVGNGSIDTGSNYANRSSENGTSEATATSQTYHKNSGSVPSDMFAINYAFNIATKEKLFISHNVVRFTAGAGTAPQRMESVGKWANTSDQFNYIETINDQAGDYTTDSNLTVLGSDLTPATAVPAIDDVQNNSLFVEKENANRYWSSGYSPANTATFTDDFSSDNWTDSDSTNIGVSGGALNWSMFRDMSNDASSRDLGSVASDKWVLRFKVTQGSSIGSTQAGNAFHFGLSDSDNSVAHNANQDFVGMAYYYDNQSSYKTHDSDNSGLPEPYTGDSSQNFTITANDVFYFEIIKNGSSYTVEGFTNSDYSTGSLGKITGTTTATGLRYLKIMNTLPAQGAIPTSTNPFNGTIDDLKFYNNVTNVDLVPATWTMQPTYKTDFSSSTGWTQTGSNITINTGTNSLTWIGDRSTSSHGLHYDIGANRVSSKWILEFDFVLDNYSAGTASYTHQIGVMLTDVDSTSGTYGSDATRNFVGMRLNWRTDTASQQRKFYVIDDNAGTDTWADNSPANSPDDSTAQSFPTAGTTYHMKLIKDDSSHSLEIWNSSQTSLLDTLNGSNSTTADIRYILVQSYNASTDGNPSFDGKIQNMKFYNGVTSIN